ncbi:MAG TPA: ZIP family metal transporter, partial [Candidatus Nanoarchaeia archaeon]|nr:ZIP family metal transporter [Candidatus Nanoarchaeia archaeon]
EIPQEIGDFGILLHAGLSRSRALCYNFLTALGALAGAVLSLILNAWLTNITAFLIPFAAGSFIYIAGADLIPELHKEVEAGKSVLQLLWFVLGIGIMMLLLFLE